MAIKGWITLGRVIVAVLVIIILILSVLLVNSNSVPASAPAPVQVSAPIPVPVPAPASEKVVSQTEFKAEIGRLDKRVDDVNSEVKAGFKTTNDSLEEIKKLFNVKGEPAEENIQPTQIDINLNINQEFQSQPQDEFHVYEERLVFLVSKSGKYKFTFSPADAEIIIDGKIVVRNRDIIWLGVGEHWYSSDSRISLNIHRQG